MSLPPEIWLEFFIGIAHDAVEASLNRYIASIPYLLLGELMTLVKTTITISEEVWEEFKRTVNSRYGGSRSPSQVVEEAIRSYNVVEMLQVSAGDLGVEIGGYPSSSEVDVRRPRFPVSSVRILREIRKE